MTTTREEKSPGSGTPPTAADGDACRHQTAPNVNDTARNRMLSIRGEPLLLAQWQRVLMIHLEADPDVLQRELPFPLDLRDGRAFVSLVMFTMRDLRPRLGGNLAAALFRPIATHEFLNVRTYVRVHGEPGIHFLTEWLSNPLAVNLGPVTFGLPYRFARIAYEHFWEEDCIRGSATDPKNQGRFIYEARDRSDSPIQKAVFTPCPCGSLDEWLMERYTAFNSGGWHKRFFRVWHPPWPQVRLDAKIVENSLLTGRWPWLAEAAVVGANFSPGFAEVWMGRPHKLTGC